jgi:hypothetical protein
LAKLVLSLLTFYSLNGWSTQNLPQPLGWSANLENVGIQDVIAEVSPASETGAEIESRFKAALEKKGLFAGKKATEFAILSPSVICNPPHGAGASEPVCMVELYLRERAAPPAKAPPKGKRVAWGVVATYYGRYTTVFPNKPEIIDEALDALLEDFMRQVPKKKG